MQLLSSHQQQSRTKCGSLRWVKKQLRHKHLVLMREEVVERAVRFLRDPRARSKTLDERMEFLKDKDCTQEEVDEAVKRAKEIDETRAEVSATRSQDAMPHSVTQTP